MSPPKRRDSPTAQYGADAPGVIIALVGSGIAAFAMGATAWVMVSNHWLAIAGLLLGFASLVPLGLGLSMVAYTAGGKHRLRNWLLAQHDWKGDEIVLDIGAGRGLMAIGAAQSVPRGRVVAIDIWRSEDLSGNGAAALLANASLEGVKDRIEIRTEDARAITLEDASVDIVLSVLCIHNIEPAIERERALSEIIRVLKPGGRALIADYTAVPSYVRFFRNAGMMVNGPIGCHRIAWTLMSLVDVRKPETQ